MSSSFYRRQSITALFLCCAGLGYGQVQYNIYADPFPSMTFPSRMLLGDFDNDGDADVLFQTGNTMGAGIGFMRNNGGGSFTQIANAATAGTPFASFSFSNQQITPSSMFVVDYDGDGDDDIIDRDNVGTGGVLGIWRNNNGVFQLASGDPFPSMTFPSRMIWGDFDNDGDKDVLFQTSNTMGAGIGYLRNNGGGSFTEFTNAAAAGTPFTAFDFSNQQITPAGIFVVDYDGDGDDDIIDRDDVGTGGVVGVWRNNNGLFQLASDPFPTNMTFPSRMLFGDYDSDGDVDALFQTGNTMGVGIGYLKNNGAGSYTQIANATTAGTPFTGFNFSNQQITPAGLFTMDYDADGDMDVADRDDGGTGGVLGIWSVGGAPPQLTASVPVSGATGVSTTNNLVLTFSEPVVSAGGQLYIRRLSNNSIFATIATNSAQVTGQGTNTITINPTANLEGNTAYYVTFDRDAFADNEGHIFGTLEPVGHVLKAVNRNDLLSFTTGAPLPVQLLYFTAAVRGADVSLDWKTASEVHAAYFEVEYSRDGLNYTHINRVDATGGIARPALYQWLHEGPGTGSLYYRLKQVDEDGSTTYSSVRSVSVEKAVMLQAAPNPVKDRLTIKVPGNGLHTLRLYDLQGRRLQETSVRAADGVLLYDMSRRPAGMYILELHSSTGQEQLKIVKE